MTVATSYNNDGPHPLDYRATLDRLEPGLAPIDNILTLTSIAVSAKRSADALVLIIARLDDLRYAIHSHESNRALADALAPRLDAIATELRIMGSNVKEMK